MATSSTQEAQRRENPILAVITIAFAVGILDGLAAIINSFLRSGVKPEQVFRFIASALLGKTAYSGGAGTALLGLGLHFLVALIWSALFFAAYPRMRWLQGNKWLTGFGYGIFIWLVMTFIVLRAAGLLRLPLDPGGAVTGILIHMFLVGLPIVMMTRRLTNHPV